MDTVNTQKRAGKKEWAGLAVIALPCVLYSMDLTVLNLAVPHLSADLQPSSSQLLWIIDIYGFLVAGFLMTMGTLGDKIGRRKLLMTGAVAFGAASILAAYSSSANMLILARAILGIAGATLAPSTLSLIRNMFHDPGQRTMAIGIWAASYSAGGAIGPLIGGLMLEHFWWGSVFLIAVPVMILLLITGPLLLPEFRAPNAKRFDLVSAVLSLFTVLPIIFSLKKIAEGEFTIFALMPMIIGIAAGTVFIRRQKRLEDPMIDLRLFKQPVFSTALGAYTLGAFVTFGTFFYSFQYLQLVLGLSSLQAGLCSLPGFLAFVAGSIFSPILLRKFSALAVIAMGLAFSSIGFMMLTQAESDSGLWYMVGGNTILSLGLAPVFTLATDIIVGTAPPERAGAASAISETGAEFGGALGIAVLGSLGTAVYRNHMAEAMPQNISPDAADASRQTLGAAFAESQKLGDAGGQPLLDAAKEAFVLGMRFSAITVTVIVIILAVISFTMIRRMQNLKVKS